MDGEEVGAGRIAASDDEVGADVTHVAEKMLLKHGHAGDDAGLTACRQGVQLELGGDEGRRELRVGRGAGPGTPDLGGDVVQLLTVLVGDDGARSSASVCRDLQDESASD